MAFAERLQPTIGAAPFNLPGILPTERCREKLNAKLGNLFWHYYQNLVVHFPPTFPQSPILDEEA